MAGRVRVDAEHQLGIEILGHVGDQPVLANHEEEVVGVEDEAIQVGPVDPGPALVGGDGLLDRRERRLLPLLGLFVGGNLLPFGAEVEAHLPEGAVPLEEKLERRLARHQDDPRQIEPVSHDSLRPRSRHARSAAPGTRPRTGSG